MAQDIGNTLENYTTVDIQDLVSCEILGSTEDSKILSVNIYASNKDEGDTISSAVKKAISDYGEIKGLSMPNLMDEVCYGGMFTGVYDTQAANESRTSALVTKRDSYVPKKLILRKLHPRHRILLLILANWLQRHILIKPIYL